MAPTDSHPALAELYALEFSDIRKQFEADGDGRAVLARRTALLDRLVRELYARQVAGELTGPDDFCLAALGGYGRQQLFPYSDIDLLFLAEDYKAAERFREPIAAISRALWDLRLRVGQRTATLAECGHLESENLEFSVALLDARHLAGGAKVFQRLQKESLPRLLRVENDALRRDLLEVTRRRHAKFGDTIFHLEPNLKEAPGGLRDYHVAQWLARVRDPRKAEDGQTAEEFYSGRLRVDAEEARRFFTAARCFLHFVEERDDNHLTYEVQERAAAAGIGVEEQAALAPADWMRLYFRHARAVNRLLREACLLVRPRPSFWAFLEKRKTKPEPGELTVADGQVGFHRKANPADPEFLLRLFGLLAETGSDLTVEASRTLEDAVPQDPAPPLNPAGLWDSFARILRGPHAAHALRTMHSLGILERFLPEFGAIDALVIRDFYHRYTVDEHTFMTIQNLHRLPDAKDEWAKQLAEILTELERPELLYFALLLHDVGKGISEEDHVVGSLRAAGQVFERWNLPAEDRETVEFLIRSHLEISATLRGRDLFDPASARELAERIAVPERLKMLTLLTYTDIKSVNPEALTPWKAEMLWRLYVAASNALTRSLDEDRVRSGEDRPTKIERLKEATPPEDWPAFSEFLEGFPRRYVAAHSIEELTAHFQMARELTRVPVRTSLKNRAHSWQLCVVTRDRPGLFALLTGALAGWGGNILKADAFANRAGIILDTFQFVDLHRTLDLNPSEAARFQKIIEEALTGERQLEELLGGRLRAAAPRPKIKIPTQVRFDDNASSHSTLLELVTADRPGLLHGVSTVLAQCGCNIQVALIDTEGQKALDVFYLTFEGRKLDAQKQEATRQALMKRFL